MKSLLRLLPIASLALLATSCLRTDTYDPSDQVLTPNVAAMPRLKESFSIDSSAAGEDTSYQLRLEYDAIGRLSRAIEIEFNHYTSSTNDTDFILYTQFIYQGQDTVASEKVMTARDYTFVLMARPFAAINTHEYMTYENGYLKLDSALSVTDIGTLMYDTSVNRYTRSGNRLWVDQQQRSGGTPTITTLRRTFTGTPEMMTLVLDTSGTSSLSGTSSYTESNSSSFNPSYVNPAYIIYKATPGYGIGLMLRPGTRLGYSRDKYLPTYREWNSSYITGTTPGTSQERDDYSYVFRPDGALLIVRSTGTSSNFPATFYGKDTFTYY